MKLFILIILVAGYFQNAEAQSVKKQGQSSKTMNPLSCTYRAKYSIAQRNQFYPFNSFDTVKIASFKFILDNLPIKKDTVMLDSLIEYRTLTSLEVNLLTDIIYNNFYQGKSNIGIIRQCFWPRNAILFVDKFGTIKEHILLCFHCNNYSASSQDIKLGNECIQKLEKLRKFFLNAGFKFGTDKSLHSYPGEKFKDDPVPRPIL